MRFNVMITIIIILANIILPLLYFMNFKQNLHELSIKVPVILIRT